MCSLQKTVDHGRAMKNILNGPCYCQEISYEDLLQWLQIEFKDLVMDYPYI
jgi:hypothetical protein